MPKREGQPGSQRPSSSERGRTGEGFSSVEDVLGSMPAGFEDAASDAPADAANVIAGLDGILEAVSGVDLPVEGAVGGPTRSDPPTGHGTSAGIDTTPEPFIGEPSPEDAAAAKRYWAGIDASVRGAEELAAQERERDAPHEAYERGVRLLEGMYPGVDMNRVRDEVGQDLFTPAVSDVVNNLHVVYEQRNRGMLRRAVDVPTLTPAFRRVDEVARRMARGLRYDQEIGDAIRRGGERITAELRRVGAEGSRSYEDLRAVANDAGTPFSAQDLERAAAVFGGQGSSYEHPRYADSEPDYNKKRDKWKYDREVGSVRRVQEYIAGLARAVAADAEAVVQRASEAQAVIDGEAHMASTAPAELAAIQACFRDDATGAVVRGGLTGPQIYTIYMQHLARSRGRRDLRVGPESVAYDAVEEILQNIRQMQTGRTAEARIDASHISHLVHQGFGMLSFNEVNKLMVALRAGAITNEQMRTYLMGIAECGKELNGLPADRRSDCNIVAGCIA